MIIKIGSQVRIKEREDNGEHQGKTGTYVHFDEHNDGDFFGVRFANDAATYYFYRW